MKLYARHKFKAKPQTVDGIRFASKLERQFYDHLKLLKKKGDVVFFLMQVPFHLPGGTKYVSDFQIFWKKGDVTFVDVKGIETATFKLKKRQVEALYPVQLVVVKKGDF